MEKRERHIFKNDLSEEQQKKQDAACENEKDKKEKGQKKLDIADGIATIVETVVDIIIDH